MFNPIHDRVIVRPDASVAVSKGGIHLPDPEGVATVRRGVVEAVGPGAPLPNGGNRPMQVRCGEVVLFGKHSGVSIPGVDGGPPLLVLREEDVLAIDPAYVETKTQHMPATLCGSPSAFGLPPDYTAPAS